MSHIQQSYIRISKTPDVERVLSDLRERFSLLSGTEIIKLALSEVYNKEMENKMSQEQKLMEAFNSAIEGGKAGDKYLADKGIKREDMPNSRFMTPFSNNRIRKTHKRQQSTTSIPSLL